MAFSSNAVFNHCSFCRLSTEKDARDKVVHFVVCCHDIVAFLPSFCAGRHLLSVHKEVLGYELKVILDSVDADDLADDVAPIIGNMQVPAFRYRLTDSSQLFQVLRCNFVAYVIVDGSCGVRWTQ